MDSSDFSMADQTSTVELAEGADPPIFDELDVFVPSKKIIWDEINKKAGKEEEEKLKT